ncbi:MAG: STAS domain-containing protein [Planctomycetes bacterium]|nr:STAS domain-containing protein [Planctomycetota bacterium]
MGLTVTRESGYVLAKTSGAIDESAGDVFRKELHPVLAERGACVIVDLSGSAFVNSAGLGHLVALVAHANTKSSRVVLCAPTPHVAGVLAVTKLDTFLEVALTLPDAIARVTK